jgi:uncharacterized protein (TIGR03066 family)
MKSKTKDRRKKQPTPQRPPAPRRGLSGPGMLGLALAMLLVAGGTWALFEYVIWNTTPPELVGKWVVMRGPQDGATFDFYRNGTMVGHVNLDGQEGRVEARIRVEDKKIYATTRHPTTGEELTRVQTVVTLTGRNLVLRDEQGELLVMERAE